MGLLSPALQPAVSYKAQPSGHVRYQVLSTDPFHAIRKHAYRWMCPCYAAVNHQVLMISAVAQYKVADAVTRQIIPDIVREHVELAAFQWAQRDTLAAEDPPDTEAIAFVDGRLEANLDALRIAGAAAWPFIVSAFESFPERGELFVAAVHAIETCDADRIEQAVRFARSPADGPRGFCAAFEWLPPKVTRNLVRKWIRASDPVRCEAAVAAFAAHGADPGDLLPHLLAHPGPRVRIAACRLAAALHRQDAVPALRQALADAEAPVRDGAALALAQLGHRDGDL